jgi:hypothetical protein
VKDSGDERALHEGSPCAEIDAENGRHEVDNLQGGGLGAQVVRLEILARSVRQQRVSEKLDPSAASWQ